MNKQKPAVLRCVKISFRLQFYEAFLNFENLDLGKLWLKKKINRNCLIVLQHGFFYCGSQWLSLSGKDWLLSEPLPELIAPSSLASRPVSQPWHFPEHFRKVRAVHLRSSGRLRDG